ncbi:PREDICTED: uncharacterized protein At4g04980-like isoform X1 [Populus euphratica]|uniref:Uncharacterized protein At4g04980-like isoform X1 n=1 Tax=Populus euphratica TaxID=75702 RepID=A0AAJ6Y7U0_POPEU|nr:PREDICTED: uncharacterized protein At4g04980-like isoform X1 [Populus euphratica]XP_011045630.1 PREDICTED: uncharacterized protein At4g04980-like isoform X1 [Populus euphratica]XP_011045631.1 PREDICTED: uncharacterized protein At4g04980-like isoform X1 [Populus euphratica]
MEDLHKLYSEALPNIPISVIKGTPVDKRVAHFCKALTYIRDSWMVRFRYDKTGKIKNTDGAQLVDVAFATFDYMIKVARELFDIPEDEELENDYGSLASTLKQSSSYPSKLVSPAAATDACAKTRESANISEPPSRPQSLRDQGTKKYSHLMQKNESIEAQKPNSKVPTSKNTKGVASIMDENSIKTLDDKPGRTGIPRAPPPPANISKEMAQSTPPPVMPSKGSVPDAVTLNKGPPPPPPPPPAMSLKGSAPNGMPPKNVPAPSPLPAMPSKGSAPNSLPLKKGPPPPPPPLVPSKGSIPNAMPLRKGPPPPPPPPVMPSKGSTPNGMPLDNVPAPPPPPMTPSKGSAPNTMLLKKGPQPPPPPQFGAGKSLFQTRPTTKLKRSTQMPNLFRDLRSKMEGSSLTVKTTNVRKVHLGGSKGGKEGLAASLAEMTKRSTYFQQVEEDIKKYSKSIIELKADINSFQTKDMIKLLKFQSNVESTLQFLTDESQVLAKFEGFPSKKLETLRTAAALYSKFDTIVTTLKNWEVVTPLGQLLDKIEKYLSKIKLELDAFERSKDEESKKFKRHNIDFEFHIVTKIRESMVNLSSNCMELALKERRESKTAVENQETMAKPDQKTKESVKMLWRVFQLAFRVYSFAGGQDDRAETLAKELADEILIDSPNQ